MSNRDLIFEYVRDAEETSVLDSIAYYLKGQKKYLTRKHQQFYRSSDLFVDCSFETFIKKSKDECLIFYAFNFDTMEKYQNGYKLSYLMKNKLYDQKIKFTVDSLDQLGWKITIK